ncbi:ADP-ribose pyrophosphatase [Clostridiales bacterium PH28_bin88]|nr:ADP-ribose pyrophosphatase [Clostridiales bacterium PH28_bin88]
MDFSEKTIESHGIFKGKIIRVRVDTVLMPNGRQATREIVEHPGAVAVVPLTAGQEVVMVRQFRKPIEQQTLEIPAGKLSPGENPAECATRELEEETGLRAGNIRHLFSFYTSPGFSDEIMHLFLATDLQPGSQSPDEDELIGVEKFQLGQLVSMIVHGDIVDAKTIVGVLAAREVLG